MSEQSRTPLVVINIVGLTRQLLGEHTPNLNRVIATGSLAALQDVFPAVTTTAQSSMVTGTLPDKHGIVGNGWYWRELAEVRFWLQPNQLVQGPKVWDRLKQRFPDFTVSKLFWWYNMYADVDYSVTPRPHYPADGRKIVGLYSEPADLHRQLENALGAFPFFNFWGPASNILSSEWIAKAARLEFEWHRPDLQFVYLPHLDYNLQRLGPDDPRICEDLAAIDRVAGELIDFVRSQGAKVMVVSEYGISPVDKAVPINRILREGGYLRVRESLSWELLDPGASRAFAVADHQVAHIYVRDSRDIAAVQELLRSVPGIAQVLDRESKRDWHVDHPRSGDLIAVADPNAWFSYYYWFEDAKAPDFAPTVDIHRKPGYDPCELFVDPDLRFPKLKIGLRLAQKLLKFRMLMDVIPIRPELVKGSHGRCLNASGNGPILISSEHDLASDSYPMTKVHDLILSHFNT